MPITKVIDNFTGKLTRKTDGELNSGLAKFATSFGNDPFSDPGNLTWFEQPTSILVSGQGATNGPIVAAKARVESGTDYVYTIFAGNGTQATINKIQVNDTGTKNPNFDTASIIGALTTNAPTFRLGAGMQFYGTTEKIFFGGESGVWKVNFDGSGQTQVTTTASSIITGVPRPEANFLGKLYFGNGTNIGEIDSTEAVTTYSKLNPGFPSGTYVRDLDVTPDGNYLQITVSRLNQTNLDGNTLDTSSLGSVDSYKFLWNGTDQSYTSYESYNGYALTANTVFTDKNYTLGLDVGGAALYNGANKILSFPNSTAPNFSAMFSTGNLLGFTMPEYNSSIAALQGSGYFYGQYDDDVPAGLYRFIRQTATLGRDVMFMPMAITVSNLYFSPAFFAYSGNMSGAAKIYYSTTEVDAAGSPSFILWKFTTVPTGSGNAIGGVYETQQQYFPRKFKPTQIRFYLEPLVASNSFKIDIIGSNGGVMNGGTQTFTVGSNDIVAGQDYVWYTPATAPTYSLGIRITNLGTKNWTGVKLEIDLEEAGQ